MKFLFLGDIVGNPGYAAVRSEVPTIRKDLQLDAVIVNAENTAGGSGITPRQYKGLIDSGVDAITMGDHIYRKKEIVSVLETSDRIVKPANFPPDAPGKNWIIIDTKAGQLAVISLLGRLHMRPCGDPYAAVDRAIEEIGDTTQHIFVDIHAETTGEKQTLGRYLDGRVTAVIGTHTHVPTADATILPRGTAFQCDAGMCGPHESILGRSISRVLKTSVSFVPTTFYVASEDVRLSGVIVESDASGLATAISRFEKPIKN